MQSLIGWFLSPWEKAWAWCRSHPVAALVVLALVVLLGRALILWTMEFLGAILPQKIMLLIGRFPWVLSIPWLFIGLWPVAVIYSLAAFAVYFPEWWKAKGGL